MFVKRVGKVAALAAVDQEREPAVGGERAERDRERRQTDDRDEEAVQEPEPGGDEQADERREPDVGARFVNLADHDDRDGEDRRDRDVDLARDDDEREPERHQADEDVRRRQVEQVQLRQEERRERAAPEADRDDQQDEHRLPAHEQRACETRRVTASCGGACSRAATICAAAAAQRLLEPMRDERVDRDRDDDRPVEEHLPELGQLQQREAVLHRRDEHGAEVAPSDVH